MPRLFSHDYMQANPGIKLFPASPHCDLPERLRSSAMMQSLWAQSMRRVHRNQALFPRKTHSFALSGG